jgi:hypothetical protein
MELTFCKAKYIPPLQPVLPAWVGEGDERKEKLGRE